jgi:hypothetical protein
MAAKSSIVKGTGGDKLRRQHKAKTWSTIVHRFAWPTQSARPAAAARSVTSHRTNHQTSLQTGPPLDRLLLAGLMSTGLFWLA